MLPNCQRSDKMVKNIDYYNLDDPKSFGGVKDFSREWLSSQLSYTLHKPIQKRFPTRKYKVSGVNDLWQMDLMEMIPYARVNRGYRYILTCIDVFSRFAQAIPVKRKNGADMHTAIIKLLKEKVPAHVQTDSGKEFYNKIVQNLFKINKITHYTVHSQYKAAVVERFNRTLREKLNRYFTHTGSKVWWNVLHRIINTYNQTNHRGIGGMKPIEVKNYLNFWEEHHTVKSPSEKRSIKINDFVRISRITQSPFKKNFDQNWSEEVFRVVKIDLTDTPTMYSIEDLRGEKIDGKFYKEELQRISMPDIFRIERIIKSKGRGKYKQYYVKWHGYSDKYNSWISSNQLR